MRRESGEEKAADRWTGSHGPHAKRTEAVGSRKQQGHEASPAKLLKFLSPLTVSRSMNVCGVNVPFSIALSRRSTLHATSTTGIDLPQILRTSSIHCWRRERHPQFRR